MATFKAYATDGTLLGTFAPESASWQHVTSEDGAGQITVAGTVSSGLLAETSIVRVNDGTSDVFAFVPTSKTRTQRERSTDVTLSGPGVRWLLHAGQIYQEDTSDCAEPARSRWFGWMSGDYDDSGWTDTVKSHGTVGSKPFSTFRPDGWPAPQADMIWSTTGPAAAGDVYFRETFVTTEAQDVVVMVAADDQHRTFLNGRELFSTLGDGPFQWNRFQSVSMRLCAGTHTLAIVARNLERPSAATNVAWLAFAVVAASGDGKPAAQSQQYEVYNDASSGTFTLAVQGLDTSPIAYNASASTVQTALEGTAAIDSGDVTVSGAGTSGDPLVIDFVGARAFQKIHLSGDGSGLSGGTLTVTESQVGSEPDVIVQSTTSASMNAYPATVPGMTPGEILGLAVAEVQARGTTVFDDFTEGYTDSVDSDSVSWGTVNLEVPLPADVHRLAALLEEAGVKIDMSAALELNAWVDRGTDVSGSVAFTAGAATGTGFVASVDESTVVNVVRLFTSEGWADVSDATSVSARGRWESGLVLEGFESPAAAEPTTDLLLADMATPQKVTTWNIPSEGSLLPYDDFQLADIVSAPGWGTSGFTATDMRVVSITGRLDEQSIVWSIQAVD